MGIFSIFGLEEFFVNFWTKIQFRQNLQYVRHHLINHFNIPAVIHSEKEIEWKRRKQFSSYKADCINMAWNDSSNMPKPCWFGN